MQLVAALIGLLILAQGVLGLSSPSTFVHVVSTFQVPPVLYFAAVVRVAVGVVLFVAAPASRFPLAFRALGMLIAAGGALTPFVGVAFAEVVLRWWSEGGAPVVRAWATFSLALGAFVFYAASARRAVA